MLPALFPLLERLEEEGIDFIVIGGVAVVVHGVIRATKDIDVVPNPSVDNLLALGNCLVTLDARSTASPDEPFGPAHHDGLLEGRSMTLTTALGDIDIVQRLPGVPPYAVLAEDAMVVELPSGQNLKVSSLAQLRAMKKAAGRTQDQADLEALPEA